MIELLAVIAIIAILAGMLLPALGMAKVKTQQIQCLGNYRQLQWCWMLYVDDYSGVLPANETRFGTLKDRAAYVATERSWLRGNAWADTTATNLRSGVLFPYNGSTAIYKCPADRSTVRDQGTKPRLRSVSMNIFMNFNPDPSDQRFWHRIGQLPSPAEAFVFIDEHETSIDNANLWINPVEPDGTWYDFPATRHHRAGVLSFADGHAEAWKWRSRETMRISRTARYDDLAVGIAAPGDLDLQRLHQAAQRPPL